MQRFFRYFFFFTFILLPLMAPAQRKGRPKTKAQLEREKRDNLRKIKEATRILEQTKQKKEASIGQLNAINEKITVQKGVIRNISSEINYLDKNVRERETVVQSLSTDLEKLKKEYAAMIYAASKTANSYNKMMFLFAAESFNQFVMRLRYLHQYSEARKAQAEQILIVQGNLQKELDNLNAKKQEKKQLLNVQLSENRNLHSLRNQQDQVITQLTRQEQDLKREVEKRQQSVRKLENLIADMVREEIARAARAARKAGSTSASVNKVTLTPETALISSSFSGNKGRFFWPVERGFISHHFGKHPHPVLKGVVIDNRGIDIQTSQGQPVRAIFEGKVLTVASIAGMNNIVMIQHGEYFTVYAKLKSVSVSEGQKVNAKDLIGTVYTNSEGTTELQFQIWKNSTNLNPEGWLLRK